VVIGLAYGGGATTPGEAYGFTAVVMFPVIAWQTKIILDGEPDVQRRLARVAVRSAGRELVAGLAVAAVAGLFSIVIAMVMPWLIGGIQGPTAGQPGMAAQLAAGAWAMLLTIPPAIALGALASRVITRNTGRGVTVLVGGVVAAIVLGLRFSPLPMLAPPLMPVARVAANEGPTVADVVWRSAQALGWAGLLLVTYARLRRTRA
jgi:hypothetical protein